VVIVRMADNHCVNVFYSIELRERIVAFFCGVSSSIQKNPGITEFHIEAVSSDFSPATKWDEFQEYVTSSILY